MITNIFNLNRKNFAGLVTVLITVLCLPAMLEGKGIMNFDSKTVVSAPFGRGDGKIGYMNGPDHTPYPEAAQAFRIMENRIMIVDTMNQRFLLYDRKTGKRLTTLWPNTETKHSYYSAVIEVNKDLFLAPEMVHRALHLFNIAGKVKYIGDETCPVDDITMIFSDSNGLLFLADKGLSEKKIKVLDRDLKARGEFAVPDMISQSVALSPDDQLVVMKSRLKGEAPEVDRIDYSVKAKQVKFSGKSSIKLRGATFPDGRCSIAGIDSRGNYYVYWSALKTYFDKNNKMRFPQSVKAVSEFQPVALFNVFSSKGFLLGEFFAPVSTSPASTYVSPQGDVYVMDYDAHKAPAGKFRLVKYFLK